MTLLDLKPSPTRHILQTNLNVKTSLISFVISFFKHFKHCNNAEYTPKNKKKNLQNKMLQKN